MSLYRLVEMPSSAAISPLVCPSTILIALFAVLVNIVVAAGVIAWDWVRRELTPPDP